MLLKCLPCIMALQGGVDILVNNAGSLETPGGGFLVLTDTHRDETFQANLMAPARLDRGLLPFLLDKASGVIIHISSIQSSMPLYDSTLPYAAAKAALTNCSKSLSNEVTPKDVRVLTVSPGFIQTTSAERMVQRLAESSGSSYDVALKGLMDALGGIPMAGRRNRKKQQSW